MTPRHTISTHSLVHFRISNSEEDDTDDDIYSLESGAADAESARVQIVRNCVLKKKRDRVDSEVEPLAGAGAFVALLNTKSACEEAAVVDELVEDEEGGVVVLEDSVAEEEEVQWQDEDGELDDVTGEFCGDGSGAARGGGDSRIRTLDASLKPETAAVPAGSASVTHAASCDGSGQCHKQADSSGSVAPPSADQLKGPWRRLARTPPTVSSAAMEPLVMSSLLHIEAAASAVVLMRNGGSVQAASPASSGAISHAVAMDAYCDDSDDTGIAGAAHDSPPHRVATASAGYAAKAESPKTLALCSAMATPASAQSYRYLSASVESAPSLAGGAAEHGLKLASSAAAASALAARMRASRDALSAKLQLVNRISSQLQEATGQRDTAAARALQALHEADAAADTSLAAAVAASAAGERETARLDAEAEAARLAAEASHLAEVSTAEAADARHAAKASASAAAVAAGSAAATQQVADEAAARVLALEAELAELTAEGPV